MNVTPWVEALDQLTAGNGWIGREDATARATARRARAVLDGFARNDCAVGHRFAAVVDANGRNAAPDEAREAMERRDAVLRLAVAHELRLWAAQAGGNGQDNFDYLVQHIVWALMTSPTGLRPKAAPPGGAPYAEVDFAHTEGAAVFFEEVVKPRLRRVDVAMGTQLTEHAGDRYDRESPPSIERWGRAWTIATALIPLDWARARGCETARDICRAFWLGSNPAVESPPRFYVLSGTLPTSTLPIQGRERVNVHVNLLTRKMLAQITECENERWDKRDDIVFSIHIPLKHLNYVPTAGDVHYRGRNILQLYLAVLADGLQNVNLGGRWPTNMKPTPSTNPAGDELGALAPAQRAALKRLRDARETLDPQRRRVRGAARLVAEPAVLSQPAVAPAAAFDRNDGGSGRPPTTIVQVGWGFVPAPDVPDADWQPIGTVTLWRNLEHEVEWVDLLCVARRGDSQTTLPITLEDAGTGDESDAEAQGCAQLRSMLVLHRAEGMVITAQQLRAAFVGRYGAVTGVCEYAGLGAFVVLEFDLGRD